MANSLREFIDWQTSYVLIPLGVPGIVMTVVFLAILVLLAREYAVAELRRMVANKIKDIADQIPVFVNK